MPFYGAPRVTTAPRGTTETSSRELHMSTQRQGIEQDSIIDRDLFLWVYERYMERKGKPLKERPVRQPQPGSPEEKDFTAAVPQDVLAGGGLTVCTRVSA